MSETDSFSEPVVIIGAKPQAAFPDVAAPVVITANAAVELGVEYRRRFGSRIVAMTSSSDILSADIWEALRKAEPDELVLLGEHVEDPEEFVRSTIGLSKTRVIEINFPERQKLLTRAVGWRTLLVALDCLHARGVKSFIKHDLRDLLFTRTYAWMSRSTGVNAIHYAMQRFPHAKEIIVAGVGLQPGGHSTGVGTFAAKTARVDRTVFSYWLPEKRARLCTTDRVMSEVGKVPLWKGNTFSI